MNTIDISYKDRSYRTFAPKFKTLSFLKKVLKIKNLINVEFSITFADEDYIHEINKQYRNIDDSTDIISFAINDKVDGVDFVNSPNEKTNIGDIIICPEVCKRNAKTFNVSENEELHRLLVHGVLHLSGMDHKTNDLCSEPMLIHQEEILKKLYRV